MSDLPSRPPLATGGMSREGTTTIVRISEPQIAPTDKKVLCSAMCQCNKMPDIGKDGRQLKQGCVAGRMKALDKLLGHNSPYKQEINYDMTKNPPAPVMDSGIETKGHDWLPGWIRKYWENDETHPPFEAGTGMIRRPDVVIVNDPTKPPTQDNIKQIIEMKFPPDTISKPQRDAYEQIAGDPQKLRKLEPSDCDCDAPEPDSPKIPVEKLGWAAAAAGWIVFGLSRGRTPRPPVPAF
ncbi:hypothetical protein AAKU55_004897 [Oxalobacteraceae bacterium GrIS 1.11]